MKTIDDKNNYNISFLGEQSLGKGRRVPIGQRHSALAGQLSLDIVNDCSREVQGLHGFFPVGPEPIAGISHFDRIRGQFGESFSMLFQIRDQRANQLQQF